MPKPSIAQPPFVMIRTFSARLRARGRSLTGVFAGGRKAAPSRGAPRLPRRAGGGIRSPRVLLGSEAGDTLIEVVISALLTGLIAVAVLTGFTETNKVSQDERAHDQAAVLAAQSQEQLRSDPASALDPLETTPHSYTQTVGGTKYTITQSAKFVNGTEGAIGCSNTKSEEGDYIAVTSSVTWSALGKRLPVTQSSIITPPDGSGLEVDINNGASPAVGVPGVTVLSGGVETTTSEAGCVIYSGIPATTANIEAYELGYVTPSGEHKIIAKEVSIAPNTTTHKEFILAQGGALKANFQYKKAAIYKNGSVNETVQGDTFVAYNSKIGVAPEYEVGSSTKLSVNSEGEYEPLTGTTTGTKAEGYGPTAETVNNSSPNYPSGNLFPFTTAWQVYAGDCTLNNPLKYKVQPGEPTVIAGKTVSVNVPMSYVKLNVYQGTSGTTAEKAQHEVKITNESCKTQSPQQVPENATVSNYEHRQNTNTEGHLEVPFQPFGKFTLCLAYNNTTTKIYRTYTTASSYENTTEEGPKLSSLYVGEPASNASWTVAPSTSPVKC
jgi:Tfp pilus assembly protein PilV